MKLIILFLFAALSLAVAQVPAIWDVLAPFPQGMREIGSDTLEAFGGIRKIPRADNTTYPSDLVNGGKVGWTKVKTINNQVVLQWNSSQVNWDLLNSWDPASTQFQGWAVGDIFVNTPGLYLYRITNVLEFFVDDKIYKGDHYAADLANYPVYLSQGLHTLYVPFQSFESTSFTIYVSEAPSSALYFQQPYIVPDVIIYDNQPELAAPYFMVPVTNLLVSRYLESITVSVQPPSPIDIIQQVDSSFTIAPGQTRPIKFQAKISTTAVCSPPTQNSQSRITFNLTISAVGTPSISVPIVLTCVKWNEGYRFTFLDFDDSVQYAGAWNPAFSCENTPNGCPVLLTFHGAQVEVGPVWIYSYMQQNYSWIIYPTNRANFGFDFQGPGRVNSLYALEKFAQNLPGVPLPLKTKYKADPYKIIYAGHSMGGHGCWAISTKNPDRALAIAPAAGWIKMQFYLPYFMRVGDSFTPPFLQSLLQASIAEDNTDFYAPNIVGIPLIVRMGSDDENVPPYHLRRMARIVDQLSGKPNIVEVSEVPGEGHWFNGVVDGPPMQSFFDRNLKYTLPPLPINFTITIMNPASFGGRGGIKILQQEKPYRESYLNVERYVSAGSSQIWVLITDNVRRFGFYNVPTQESPSFLILEGNSVSVNYLPDFHYCKLSPNSSWTLCKGEDWMATERSPANYGPMMQILEAPIIFVYGTLGTQNETSSYLEAATFLSNYLWYQGRYSIAIVRDIDLNLNQASYSNLVLFGGPLTNIVSRNITSPVTFSGRNFKVGSRIFNEPGTGIGYLGSWGFQRLAAVFAGTDDEGFKKSWRLFVVKSGMTIPDYVVVGPTFGWQGTGGFEAAGFWNNFWQFDSDIGYVKRF